MGPPMIRAFPGRFGRLLTFQDHGKGGKLGRWGEGVAGVDHGLLLIIIGTDINIVVFKTKSRPSFIRLS